MALGELHRVPLDQALTLSPISLQDFDSNTLVAKGDGVLTMKAMNKSDKAVAVRVTTEYHEFLARPSFSLESTAPAEVLTPLVVEWHSEKELVHTQKIPLDGIYLAPNSDKWMFLGVTAPDTQGVYEVHLSLDNGNALRMDGINSTMITPETHFEMVIRAQGRTRRVTVRTVAEVGCEDGEGRSGG